jgi:DNA polymerase
LWLPNQPVPAEFKEAARDPSWTICAFNDGFETSIETHVLAPRFKWPLTPIERHRCIQARALAHALPAALGDCAVALGLRHAKDKEGARLMRQMARPRHPRQGEDPRGIYYFDDEERLERLYSYCTVDVEAERELMERLRPLCAREEKIWLIDQQINQRGVRIDCELARKAQRIVEDALDALDHEIAELTGGAVTRASQVDRIMRWAASEGCSLPSLTKVDLEKALQGGLPARVRRIVELRLESAQSSTKKVSAMLQWAGDGDRIRGSFLYHKASPGRWAGAGPQLQNLRKLDSEIEIPVALKTIATGDHTRVAGKFGRPLALVGKMLRPMLVAAPGHRFIGADFSGIEARVLAWLSNEESKLEAFRCEDTGGPSVYAVTAGKLYNRDPGTITKDSPERAAAKICELAFGFLGGLQSFRNFEAKGAGTGFTDAQVERFKAAWREAHPNIIALGHRLNAAAIAAVWTPGKTVWVNKIAFRREQEFLWLRLPSSRKIAYPFPRLIPNGRIGEYAVCFKDNSEGQWRDTRGGRGAWPGIWSENVTQAVARDLLAEALHRLEAAGYPVVLHAHDEVLAEVSNGRGSIEEFKRIFTTLPKWADGLPIACDAFENQRYVKK